MVLNELNSGSEVRLIELVRNVPANWTKLAPLLTTQQCQLAFSILKDVNLTIKSVNFNHVPYYIFIVTPKLP